MKDLEKTIDDMQMSINEKEAEIIRLNLCLGDEKKKNTELVKVAESTPKRSAKETRY
jgi:uncharacterized protein YaaN involved in tellurite resistance